MRDSSVIGLAGLGLVLGVRHGLDWDHLTAIGDLAGGPGQGRVRSLTLAFCYIVGHSAVMVLLGTMVGVLGVRLPPSLDRVFEVVVGTTLVVLGVLVLWQMCQQRFRYQVVGRWSLLVGLLRSLWLRHRPGVNLATPILSRRAAFSIGVLHGTGAETPTQLTLFAGAAAAGSTAAAALVVLAFLVGLAVADLAVALFWIGGRTAGLRTPPVQLGLGLLAGASSAVVGLAFLAQKVSALPSLLGG